VLIEWLIPGQPLAWLDDQQVLELRVSCKSRLTDGSVCPALKLKSAFGQAGSLFQVKGHWQMYRNDWQIDVCLCADFIVVRI
jgi:hypothetical protein